MDAHQEVEHFGKLAVDQQLEVGVAVCSSLGLEIPEPVYHARYGVTALPVQHELRPIVCGVVHEKPFHGGAVKETIARMLTENDSVTNS